MIRRYNVFDEVVKQVVPFGNGSIVYTPKKWVGQQVRVILEAEPVDVNAGVMQSLQPFLQHIGGIFLYGSFARGEQTPDSDIDVLVVSDRKFKLRKKGRFDFTVTDADTLKKELHGKDPFYFYSILQEAKPILNEELLLQLQKIKINRLDFKWLLQEAESALKIVEQFLQLDKLEKRKELDSTAIIYSMILRMRRLFLVQCILKNEKHSNREFKSALNKKGLPKELVARFYEIYNAERDERKPKASVSIQEAALLYQITKNELRKMREACKKCQKRKSSRE